MTVDEIVRLIGIALGDAAGESCPAGDGNGDGQVTVDEILMAVQAGLGGCT